MPPLIKPPTKDEIEQALRGGAVTGNAEINSALLQFQQSPYNPDIPMSSSVVKDNASKSSTVRLLMRLSGGSIKEEKQATRLILTIVVVLIITSFVLVVTSNKRPSPPSRDRIDWVAGPR